MITTATFRAFKASAAVSAKIAALLIMAALLVSSSLYADEAAGSDRQFKATAAYGAVSSGHPLASQVAMKILQKGGNAVDAAVAAGFMLGVVDFSNSGIGGDGFALLRLPGGQIVAFDASTRRPANRRAGGKTSYIGLPTVPELLLKLLRFYGSKWPAEVMAPAVLTCIKGFKVSAYLEKVVEKRLLTLEDSGSIDFLTPEGYPMRAGQVFRQPKLARTLMQMARDGGRSFYQGEDAKMMLADMAKRGSTYQLSDLAGFRSTPVKPVKYNYKEYSIYGTPPPSCSVATIKLALDLLAENMKLFPETPDELMTVARAGQKVISAKYSSMAACLSRPEAFAAIADNAEVPAPDADPAVIDTNTTHLCVWDKNGMVVSMTLTLGNHFGTGELAPGGFFYNNGLRNYSKQVAAYPADYPENAGPVSAKSPVLVTRNGRPWLAIGGAGADKIIFNTALTLARVLSGHALEKSVAAPRFYLDYRNKLKLEWQKNPELLKQLRAKMPDTEIKPGCDDFFGLVSAIQAQGSRLLTVADQRRDGSCAVEEP